MQANWERLELGLSFLVRELDSLEGVVKEHTSSLSDLKDEGHDAEISITELKSAVTYIKRDAEILEKAFKALRDDMVKLQDICSKRKEFDLGKDVRIDLKDNRVVAALVSIILATGAVFTGAINPEILKKILEFVLVKKE